MKTIGHFEIRQIINFQVFDFNLKSVGNLIYFREYW